MLKEECSKISFKAQLLQNHEVPFIRVLNKIRSIALKTDDIQEIEEHGMEKLFWN
jgi:hypothetical protein